MAFGAFQTITVTATSSASADVYTLGTERGNLGKFDQFTIDATIGGNGGGAIDVVVMRKVATDDWREWLRFPQVAANTTKRYTHQLGAGNATTTETATCTDTVPPSAFVMSAGCIGGHPGQAIKLCVLAGTGASAAVPQTVLLKAWQQIK